MADAGRKPTIASLPEKLEKLTDIMNFFHRNTTDKLSAISALQSKF